MPAPPAARASLTSQVGVYAVCALALVPMFVLGGAGEQGVVAALALAVGVTVAVTTRVDRFFTSISGVAAALGTVAVLGTALGTTGVASPGAALAVVHLSLVVLGLDWRQVKRLRALPPLFGLWVLVAVGSEEGWALGAAVAWVGLALAALWSLELDQRRAIAHLAPAAAGPSAGARPSDLAGALGLALAAGTFAALFLGRPSCSPPSLTSSPPTPAEQLEAAGDRGGDASGAPSGGSGGRGGGVAPTEGEVPPDVRPNPDGAPLEVQVGPDGSRYLEDPDSGERLEVVEEGGRTVLRNQDGDVVGELDGSALGVPDGDGGLVEYGVDARGRIFVESGGDRLYLGAGPDGTVLRDEQGRIVAEGGPDADHLVIRDPDGDVVVPDPDGDGRIPIPDPVVRNGVFGTPEERADLEVLVGPDETVVIHGDGSTRTYDTDEWGRRRVRVTSPDGAGRTWVYEEAGPYQRVYEYDDDGRLLNTYRYDPEGVLVDREATAGSGPTGPDPGRYGDTGSAPGGVNGAGLDAASEGAPTPEADAPEPGSSISPWVVVAVIAGLAATALAAWWAIRRRQLRARPWAEQLVARIDHLGRVHGRGRARTETVLQHAAALAADAVPDPRLEAVARVVSDALFDRTEPTPATRAWAEAALAEVEAAHPAPHRASRRRPRPDPVTPATPAV